MRKVLIVEDSKVISLGLRQWIKRELNFDADIAENMAQAKALVEDNKEQYFLALLDLNLPDAPKGQIVDYMVGQDMPSIVVTAEYKDDVRKTMMSKGIVDFVVKKHVGDMGHLLKSIRRIYNNMYTKALVVDDTRVFRHAFRQILLTQRLTVLEAENGVQALKLIEENPDIKLVLTDYHMPEMDGFKLVQEIRKSYNEDRMAVLVLSTDESASASPMFLKVGANDFIPKHATNEEILCRVNLNLFILELVEEIRDSANRDYLTKIYNRRYFYEWAQELFQTRMETGGDLIVAMADIDHFKKVNDTYGHHVGDVVIQTLANLLRDHVGNHGLVARFGGEEFCMMLVRPPKEGIAAFFESMRQAAEDTKVEATNQTVHFTISIGVNTNLQNTLDDTINVADKMLYNAKEHGRNQVHIQGLATP